MPEFEDVFSAVEQGKAQQGIIPIENSLTGSIHQNYDLLLESDLSITGEIFLRVSHYLIANHGVKPHNVKRVYSHPQGLAQCQKFLKKMPQAERIPVSNTAAAVRKIKAGAVEINGEKVRDLVLPDPPEELIIQVGKNWRKVQL